MRQSVSAGTQAGVISQEIQTQTNPTAVSVRQTQTDSTVVPLRNMATQSGTALGKEVAVSARPTTTDIGTQADDPRILEMKKELEKYHNILLDTAADTATVLALNQSLDELLKDLQTAHSNTSQIMSNTFNYLETLLDHVVGDPRWRNFIDKEAPPDKQVAQIVNFAQTRDPRFRQFMKMVGKFTDKITEVVDSSTQSDYRTFMDTATSPLVFSPPRISPPPGAPMAIDTPSPVSSSSSSNRSPLQSPPPALPPSPIASLASSASSEAPPSRRGNFRRIFASKNMTPLTMTDLQQRFNQPAITGTQQRLTEKSVKYRDRFIPDLAEMNPRIAASRVQQSNKEMAKFREDIKKKASRRR